MLLIGQFDSPFVRRVGIALHTYGLAYEHASWSTFGDAERIAPYNPLRRVPTLVLDGGVVLVDSTAILERIDALAGPERASLARGGAQRQALLRWCAFAAGVADKGVSLVYESAFRDGLPMWVARCRAQIDDTLDLLERERAATGTWLFDDAPSHADVMLGTALCFLSEALPGTFDLSRRPALARHSAACEALPAFRLIYQAYALTPPEAA